MVAHVLCIMWKIYFYGCILTNIGWIQDFAKGGHTSIVYIVTVQSANCKAHSFLRKSAPGNFKTKNVTGPAKISQVGSQNLTTFQTFVSHAFLPMATQFSEIVHNLTGFPTHLTESKYYISVLRYVSSNHMVYFSPNALFSQAQSQN